MSERDIIRQKIWSLIGDAAIHAHAYTINPAKHRWVMGKEMFELLSEGSGTTLLAAANMGRKAYGFEIKKDFYAAARSKVLTRVQKSLFV